MVGIFDIGQIELGAIVEGSGIDIGAAFIFTAVRINRDAEMLNLVVCSEGCILFDLETIASPRFVVLVGPVFKIVAGLFWGRDAGIFMWAEAFGIVGFDAVIFAAIWLNSEGIVNLVPERLEIGVAMNFDIAITIDFKVARINFPLYKVESVASCFVDVIFFAITNLSDCRLGIILVDAAVWIDSNSEGFDVSNFTFNMEILNVYRICLAVEENSAGNWKRKKNDEIAAATIGACDK